MTRRTTVNTESVQTRKQWMSVVGMDPQLNEWKYAIILSTNITINVTIIIIVVNYFA